MRDVTVTALSSAEPAASAAGEGELPAPQHHLNFWQRYWVQHVLPFGTSVLLHALLIILVVLTCKAVQSIVKTAEKEQIIIPDSALVMGADVGGIPNPGMGKDPDRAVAQATDASISESRDVSNGVRNVIADPALDPNSAGETSALMSSSVPSPGRTGVSGMSGASSGALAEFGVPGGGGGMGPRSTLFGHSGNAMRIVYVCDGSGSMMDKLELLKQQLEVSVDRLSPVQTFDVVFFQSSDDAGDQQQFVPLARTALSATAQNKRALYGFLDTIKAKNTTHVIPALTFAFQMDPKPDLIYLLSDGIFEDEGFDAVKAAVDRLDADKKVKINTILLLPQSTGDPDLASEMNDDRRKMQSIADETQGVFVSKSVDDFLNVPQ